MLGGVLCEPSPQNFFAICTDCYEKSVKLKLLNGSLILLCHIRKKQRSLIIQRSIVYGRRGQWTPAYAYAFLQVAVVLPSK